MATQVTDIEVLKDIPGYKAIMKAVLKTQIQMLVEQLSDHTGEESIILTASVNDGSLSHLGSNTGKGFLDGREEIKSQFLGYCLKSHHKKKTEEVQEPYQRSNVSNSGQKASTPQPHKRPRPHPVSLSRSQPSPVYQDDNLPPPPTKKPFRKSGSVSHEQFSDLDSRTIGNVHDDAAAAVKPVIVKQEPSDTDIVSGEASVSEQSGAINSNSFRNSQSLPTSLQLSHTQTSGDAVHSETSQLEESNSHLLTDESLKNTSIKLEPVTDPDDLEITGVEMAEGISDNSWQNVSGAIGGYETSDVGDSSYDQGTNQSGYDNFPCHLCDKDYQWQASLNKHLKGCHSEPQYPCQNCIKVFRYKASLDQHVASKHTQDCGKFMCDLCGAEYITKWGLTRHCQSLHEPNNYPYICRSCGKGYGRKDLLQAHELTHLPKTKCSQCGKEVFHIKEHAKHCSSLKKKQTYECNLCTRKFKEPRYLREHLKSKHNPTVRHRCENCGSKFNYRASLLNHKKTCKK